MTASASHTCPFCRQSMDVGFLVDRQHHGMPGEPNWVEGVPEKSFWSGIKLKDKTVLKVATWRCPRCGFLASFANEPVKT